MSLDVYLTLRDAPSRKAEDRIYIREDGQTKEISFEEWNKRFPGREPVVVKGALHDRRSPSSVYCATFPSVVQKSYHGIDPVLASERLHNLKDKCGYGADDNVIFDFCGGVYDPETLDWIGSLTEGGAQRRK